jgi:DNA polymerase III subunit epsilon
MLKNIVLDRTLVVLDLETTGKATHRDRIVEISLMKLNVDGTNEIKTRRLNPGIPIPPGATAVHKITDADVADKNTFRQIARGLVAYLEGCDLCGYNIWSYDLKLLQAEFKRVGMPFSTEGRRIIDVKRIFFKREPRNLAAALKYFCGREHDGAHGAEADVLATTIILDAQAERYEDMPRNIADLHAQMEYPDIVDPDGKFIRDEHGVVLFAFGPHSDLPLDEIARTDPGFLNWMLKKDFSEEVIGLVREAMQRVGSAAEPGVRLD